MRQAGVHGEIMAWRDVLHEGPVPGGMSLDELAVVRARFISERGWESEEKALRGFRERDAQLGRFGQYDKVILWFEHDLYDQLQLLQILSRLARQQWAATQIRLLCIDRYLGRLAPTELSQLIGSEQPVSRSQLDLAEQAWTAFCADTPQRWEDLLSRNTSSLPFLQGCVLRMLEEYPDLKTGLSRTETQALQAVAAGVKRPGKIFEFSQSKEERMFMGDSTFWDKLITLLRCRAPLLALPDGVELTLPSNPEQELTITALGRQVLAGRQDWLDMIDVDRWFGGVHITNQNPWCWDAASKRLVKKET